MMPFAIQHQLPVGQGGLHLTSLYAEELREPILSMVFDCGGYGSKGIFDRQLIRVRNQLRRSGEARILDLLVLSHLHFDHINGFNRLVTGPKVTIKKLLIPHYDEASVAIMLAKAAAQGARRSAIQMLGDVLTDPIRWFTARGVEQVIEMATDPDDGEFRPEFPDPEPTREGGDFTLEVRGKSAPVNPEDPESAQAGRSVFRNGATLDMAISAEFALFWRFIPYARRNASGGGHGDRTRLLDQVNAILQPYRQPDGSLQLSGATKVIKAMDAAYRAYTPAAKWNPISLTLANGLNARSSANCHSFPRFHYGERGMHDHFFRSERPDAGSWYWMHTGDAELVGPDGKAWRQFFASILPSVAVFQAPHHASVENLDRASIEALPAAGSHAFATCKLGDKKHPSAVIAEELHRHGIELWPVSSEANSAFGTTLLIHVRGR